ncbi:MAG: nuclear transport factor 2 family protein [Bacteroidales bacterium]|nr:nuclear transport factor 2 family protein [Bacteroidales bacterium]
MKKYVVLLIILTFALSDKNYSQCKDDTLGIIQAALNYFEGWYEGDSTRLDQGLHDQLTKQTKKVDKETGKEYISDGSKAKLKAYAANKGDRGISKEELEIQATIFDIHGDIASVLVQSKDYYDYAHVLKIDDEWQILHVLWERKPKKD